VDDARDEFAARGCSVLVVSQAKPEVLSRYVERQKWTVPVVSDPERAAYHAFGLERTRWRTFSKPRVLWGYLRGVMKGYRVKKPAAGEDVLQLGGDFLVSRDQKVVFAYRSADPTDRPSIVTLMKAIPSAPPMGDEPAPDGPSR
jgi:peroxiredoxin